jgi:hypothetical protein
VPADNARPPVAVRVVRPYDSDDAFLESELETVGKTSVILIGAHPRPTGVILRFEVTLASGTTALRGEGRVLAYKENAFRGQPGLALRFTRLDPKSKALVDRAAAIREARLARDSLPPPSDPNPIGPLSVPAVVSSSDPAPPAAASSAESAVPAAASSSSAAAEEPSSPSVSPPRRSQRPRASVPPADPVLARALTSPTPEPPAVEPVSTIESNIATSPITPEPSEPAAQEPEPLAQQADAQPTPSDRDALLGRLRKRAAALTDEQRAAILRVR